MVVHVGVVLVVVVVVVVVGLVITATASDHSEHNHISVGRGLDEQIRLCDDMISGKIWVFMTSMVDGVARQCLILYRHRYQLTHGAMCMIHAFIYDYANMVCTK